MGEQQTPIRDSQTEVWVSLRPATLLDAVCVALESDEFVQIVGAMRDEGRGRCAYGVIAEVLDRAGIIGWDEPDIVQACHAAAARLGYASLDAANDGGVPFAAIADALRQVRDSG